MRPCELDKLQSYEIFLGKWTKEENLLALMCALSGTVFDSSWTGAGWQFITPLFPPVVFEAKFGHWMWATDTNKEQCNGQQR